MFDRKTVRFVNRSEDNLMSRFCQLRENIFVFDHELSFKPTAIYSRRLSGAWLSLFRMNKQFPKLQKANE